MERNVVVAAIQMQSIIGDTEHNVEKACALIDAAAAAGAQVICLPELFNTGYFCHISHQDPAYFDLAEPLDGYTIGRISAKAKEHGAVIVAPIFEKAAAGIYYNSAVVINDDGSVNGCFRKVHVPWSFFGWEKYYFRPGDSYPVFPTRYGNIGVMICYDRFFPEVARSLALGGAELVLVPAGAPRAISDIWEYILRARAHENEVFVLATNTVGKVDSEHYEMNGQSLLVDPEGKLLAKLDRDEATLIETIDLGRIDAARLKRTYFRDRMPATYGRIGAKEAP